MRKPYYVLSGLGLVLLSLTTAVGLWSNLLLSMGMVVFGFAFLIATAYYFLKQLREKRGAIFASAGPLLFAAAVAIAIPVCLCAGLLVADMRSRARLKIYAKIVEDIRAGKIAVGSSLSEVTIAPQPAGAKQIRASRQPDGSVLVIILTSVGFPLHHVGYVMNVCETNQNCSAQFDDFSKEVSLVKKTDGWYYFSD